MISMASLHCRLFPYEVADGPLNMARDEVLLETALTGEASLRFYGWTEATVSLGYFQSAQVRLADDRLIRLPFVRRPTGGALLVHHHEVTYALALPAGATWQSGEPWLRRMHGIISAALGQLRVPAHLHTPTAEQPRTGILCFQHCTPGDLLIGPTKVVGSAQRKQRGCLLQHGAILLARSPFAPVLAGIRELCGRALTPQEACHAVGTEFAAQTGWQLNSVMWTPLEQLRTESLAAEKYSQDRWNGKR